MSSDEFILIVVAAIVTLSGFWCGARSVQSQAIDRGHAEWRIIPGTNKTEFEWKDEQ